MIEVKQFHQYVIRIDGLSRVTLRNRQHLRKFIPFHERPNIDQAINIPLPAPVTCESNLPGDPPSPVANLGKPPVIPVTQRSLEPPAFDLNTGREPSTSLPNVPDQAHESQSPTREPTSSHKLVQNPDTSQRKMSINPTRRSNPPDE